VSVVLDHLELLGEEDPLVRGILEWQGLRAFVVPVPKLVTPGDVREPDHAAPGEVRDQEAHLGGVDHAGQLGGERVDDLDRSGILHCGQQPPEVGAPILEHGPHAKAAMKREHGGVEAGAGSSMPISAPNARTERAGRALDPVARALRQGGGQVTIARRARELRCAPGL
jgi:hypothetical protein